MPVHVTSEDQSDARFTESDVESLQSPANGSSTEESDNELCRNRDCDEHG